MAENSKKKHSMSEHLAISKAFIALLRDAGILLLAVTLIIWPQNIKSFLVDIGVSEVNAFGLKAKLTESDGTLLEARASITDLQAQNEKLVNKLNDLKSNTTDPKIQEEIAVLDASNKALSRSSDQVLTSVNDTTSENAPVVQQILESTGNIIKWGVVYGSDRKLNEAQYELTRISKNMDISEKNLTLYYQSGFYRSVEITSSRLQAQGRILIAKVKREKVGAYIVNMTTWCPDTIKKDNFFECLGTNVE